MKDNFTERCADRKMKYECIQKEREGRFGKAKNEIQEDWKRVLAEFWKNE
jgi:hypothetical protein